MTQLFEPEAGGAPRLYATPLGVDFCAALIEGLDDRLSGQPPEAIARVEILVANARMLRRLQSLYLARGPGFLPRLRTVAGLSEASDLAGLEPAMPPPPPQAAPETGGSGAAADRPRPGACAALRHLPAGRQPCRPHGRDVRGTGHARGDRGARHGRAIGPLGAQSGGAWRGRGLLRRGRRPDGGGASGASRRPVDAAMGGRAARSSRRDRRLHRIARGDGTAHGRRVSRLPQGGR